MEMVKIIDKVKKLVLSNTSSDLADCFTKSAISSEKLLYIIQERKKLFSQ